MPYTIAPSALHEIDEIVLSIKEDNPFAAEKWLSKLIERFSFLGNFPRSGREKDVFGANIRIFPFGNYLVLYEITDEAVTIVHVIHGARDLPNIDLHGA